MAGLEYMVYGGDICMNSFLYEKGHISKKKIIIAGVAIVCIACMILIILYPYVNRNFIYYDLNVRSESTYITEKMKPSSEYGGHLRLYFENNGEEAVKVTLAQCSLGGYDNRMIFSVGAGKSMSKDYYSDRLGKQKYVVILKTETDLDGRSNMIFGDLKIRQY